MQSSSRLTVVAEQGGVGRIGHDERKLGTNVPVGHAVFLRLCRVQVDGDLVGSIVALREEENAPNNAKVKRVQESASVSPCLACSFPIALSKAWLQRRPFQWARGDSGSQAIGLQPIAGLEVEGGHLPFVAAAFKLGSGHSFVERTPVVDAPLKGLEANLLEVGDQGHQLLCHPFDCKRHRFHPLHKNKIKYSAHERVVQSVSQSIN